MTISHYPALFEPEPEGGFTVSFPDFATPRNPGAGGYTYGATREAALRQAADLLETIIANHLAENWDLPAPGNAPSPKNAMIVAIALEPLVAAKLALFRAMRAAGITKAELARRMNIAPQQAQRLFDTNHNSRIDQLAAAFQALGRRLVIADEAA